MRRLLKSRRRAQFFLISAVLIVSIFSSLAHVLNSFYFPDIREISLFPEMHYIDEIKRVMCGVAKTRSLFGDEVFEIHLNETEMKLKDFLAEQGVILSISHEIKKDRIVVRYNLTSLGFKSESEIECPTS